MWSNPHRLALAAAAVLMTVRAALAISVVPPWQGPDEPAHFLRITSLYGVDQKDEGMPPVSIESSIIRSMAEHRWWESYESVPPDPLPTSFSDPALSDHVARQDDAGPVYPAMAVVWLHLWQRSDLLAQYTLLRWLSAVFGVLTIACAWAGTRLLFGPVIALAATLVISLHPQFLLMSVAVNPAAFVTLCGAVVWWQSARLCRRNARGAIWAMLVCAAAAVFSKRAAAPLLPLVILLCGVELYGFATASRYNFSRRVRRWSTFLIVVVTAVTLGTLGAPPRLKVAIDNATVSLATELSKGRTTISGQLGRLLHYWSEAVTTDARRPVDRTFVAKFHQGFYESFWLKAGWLRYPAPYAWYLATLAVIVMAVVGLFLGLYRRPPDAERTGLALATLLVLVQVAVVYLTFFRNGWFAQGQYLFLVEAPIMALLTWGCFHIVPNRAQVVIGGVLVVIATLDLLAWTRVLLPAYA